MEFGDVVTAVASLVVAYMLLFSVLLGIMIPLNSTWGPDIAMIVSVFVASLIVGYMFAGKINEDSKRGAIWRIVVLSTVMLTLFTMALFTNPYVGVIVEEELTNMFSTGEWTTLDWLAYSQMLMLLIVAMGIVFYLVFSFVGLYVGSMLRGSKKD
ncbi:MAG: hypothetical protein JSV51_01150 [Candidatus Bathyarchaeota archaeon]|nr:MAG: hypothetical protein JSV51_01150 [Candidatus Bathyarchaeota archaeon]